MKINEHLLRVERYSAIRSTNKPYLRLDMAERAINFDESFFENFLKTLKQEDFITYPSSGDYEFLVRRIEDLHKLPAGTVTLGAGSDTLIKQIFQLTCKLNSQVVTTNPCFPMYGVYADMYESSLVTMPYDSDLKISISEIKSKVTEKTSLVVLANPNSPIGDYKNRSELADLASFLADRGILFLIDEAYCEYAKATGYYSMADLALDYPNVVLVRTFSKAWGGAGSRVGYAIAGLELSRIIQNLRLTFPITGASLKYINHLLNNQESVFEYITSVKEERIELVLALKESGFDVIDSHVNWIHFNDSEDNELACRVLNSFGIAFKRGVTIPHDERKNWIRLTICPGLTRTTALRSILHKESTALGDSTKSETESLLELARDSSILNSPRATRLRDWMPEPLLRHAFLKFYHNKIFCDIGCASGAIALSASIHATTSIGIEISSEDHLKSVLSVNNDPQSTFTKICEYAKRQDTNLSLHFGKDATTSHLPFADFYLANVLSSNIQSIVERIERVNKSAHIAIVVPITPPGLPATRNKRNRTGPRGWLNDNIEEFLKTKNFKMKMYDSICGFERFIAVSSCLELPDL